VKWWKKIKQQVVYKSDLAREYRLKQRFGDKGIAKQCMHCAWLVYREEKPRNWVCRCPDERLKFRGTTCFGFVPGEHPEMVLFNSR